MAIAIGRPINGITINGLEYLLDDDGNEMCFDTKEDAMTFLRNADVPESAIESFEYIERSE